MRRKCEEDNGTDDWLIERMKEAPQEQVEHQKTLNVEFNVYFYTHKKGFNRMLYSGLKLHHVVWLL